MVEDITPGLPVDAERDLYDSIEVDIPATQSANCDNLGLDRIACTSNSKEFDEIMCFSFTLLSCQ